MVVWSLGTLMLIATEACCCLLFLTSLVVELRQQCCKHRVSSQGAYSQESLSSTFSWKWGRLYSNMKSLCGTMYTHIVHMHNMTWMRWQCEYSAMYYIHTAELKESTRKVHEKLCCLLLIHSQRTFSTLNYYLILGYLPPVGILVTFHLLL